jgi:hypothetical protein
MVLLSLRTFATGGVNVPATSARVNKYVCVCVSCCSFALDEQLIMCARWSATEGGSGQRLGGVYVDKPMRTRARGWDQKPPRSRLFCSYGHICAAYLMYRGFRW